METTMTYQEIYEIYFQGDVHFCLETMYTFVRNNLMPDPTKVTREQFREWTDTFAGRLLRKNNGKNTANYLCKCFNHIPDFNEWDRQTIDTFCAFLDSEGLAPSTYQLYLRMCKTCLSEVADDIEIPCKGWRKKLSKRGEQSEAVFLTEREIQSIYDYVPENEQERYVRKVFLISALTGARHSDAMVLNLSNIDSQGQLTFTSQKTKITTSMPCGERLRELLSTQAQGHDNSRDFNNTIRDICRKVGIDKETTIHRKGRRETGAKYEFVTSHTARRSFVTNLVLRGVDTISIRNLAGHTDISTTERYICTRTVNTSRYKDFFR